MIYSDYYWLNDESRDFLSRGYINGITAEERIKQICDAAERILSIEGYSIKLQNYVAKGYVSFSSPVWANFGLKRGLASSCNGSFISDRMDSILEKTAEIGMMTKNGAGTSVYLGNLRPRGSKISTGGESTGTVHFAELFESVTNIISQSSVRRGSCAIYLPVEHEDIEEFLEIRSTGHPIQKLSIGVCISDKWMNELLEGNKKNRKIWAKIIEKRFESGYPYIFFTDTVNKNAPLVYQNKEVLIHASNLCVTGDQRVVSNKGLLTAQELYTLGEPLTLFNGYNSVPSSPMKLIERNAKVFKVTLDNGMEHKITPYHKVLTKEGFKKCSDLIVGDKIAIQTQKGLFGTVNMPKEAFLLGMYQGDGTNSKKSICFDIWENDFDLEPKIKEYHDYICDKYNTQIGQGCRKQYNKPIFHECVVTQSKVRKRQLQSNAVIKANLGFKKGVIPNWIYEGDEETIWEYIKGLFYTDGTVNIAKSAGNPLYLSLCSINKEWLKEIQLLLANLGMQSSIRILRKAGKTLLPDGKGGRKEYDCKDAWRLIIENKNDALIFEKMTGFLSRKNKKLEDRCYRDNTKKYYKVVEIIEDIPQDVYCPTINSWNHLFICQGMFTHNCSEINLFSDENESFVCTLSSVNLLHYEDWKDTDLVETMIYFLDAVTTEYIEKTALMPFMSAANRFAKNQRAIGLGVLGYHSYLQSKMIPFESMEAKYENNKIFKQIQNSAEKATKELANKYGEPSLLKGYGKRNTTTCVTSDTLILTSEGQQPIINCVGKETEIWNGFNFSKVIPYETGTHDIFKITLSNGKYIKCTENHIFKIVSPIKDATNFNNKKVLDVSCNKLRIGDCLAKFLLPIIDTKEELLDAYTQGFFTGDGSVSNTRLGKYPRKEIRLYGSKSKCANRIVWKNFRHCNYNGRTLIRGYINNEYKNKYFVPLNFSLDSKLNWLAGIIDSDGHSNPKGIAISTAKYEFALNISYLLQEMGCHSYVATIKRSGGYTNGGVYYSVQLSLQSCTILSQLGLKTERVVIPVGKKGLKDCPNYNWVEIINIEKLLPEKTYCFTEPKNNTGVFNGIYTGQCAVAPTTSSSFILGQVSQSIEPWDSNYFVEDLAKGKFTRKNRHLKELLQSINKDTNEVWNSILQHGGSVQHLNFLTDNQKAVFKTFSEISQKEIVIQAAQRQKYIDQSQSLNLKISKDINPKEVSDLLIFGWQQGIKTFYYQHGVNANQQLSRSISNCVNCEA